MKPYGLEGGGRKTPTYKKRQKVVGSNDSARQRVIYEIESAKDREAVMILKGSTPPSHSATIPSLYRGGKDHSVKQRSIQIDRGQYHHNNKPRSKETKQLRKAKKHKARDEGKYCLWVERSMYKDPYWDKRQEWDARKNGGSGVTSDGISVTFVANLILLDLAIKRAKEIYGPGRVMKTRIIEGIGLEMDWGLTDDDWVRTLTPYPHLTSP